MMTWQLQKLRSMARIHGHTVGEIKRTTWCRYHEISCKHCSVTFYVSRFTIAHRTYAFYYNWPGDKHGHLRLFGSFHRDKPMYPEKVNYLLCERMLVMT